MKINRLETDLYPAIKHRDWIRGSQQGDRIAQERLYRAYARAMFNLCLRLLGDRAAAEDALQEAFLKAFLNIHRYEEKATFGAWLKRIVVNHCLSELRKKKTSFISIDDAPQISEQVATDETGLPELEPGAVNAAIKGLPDGCRTVFTLYELEGFDHEEISDIMGVSISTSKSQLHRARKLLKTRLSEPINA